MTDERVTKLAMRFQEATTVEELAEIAKEALALQNEYADKSIRLHRKIATLLFEIRQTPLGKRLTEKELQRVLEGQEVLF